MNRSEIKGIVCAGLAALLAFLLIWVLVNHRERPSHKLRTVCANGTSPSRITQVRGTYFYTCPDGKTGWVD